MTTRPRTTMARPLAATLAALALTGFLGACGGGGGGDGDDVASATGDDGEQAQGDEQSDEAAEQELYDWVECMRDEGVDIPDPTRDADGNLVINGNGISIGGGEGTSSLDESDAPEEEQDPIDPEEMTAAEEACGAPPGPGAGEMSEEDVQAQQQAALDFADCMREEGIEDFPDPDFSNSGPGGEAQTYENEGDGGDGPTVAGPFGQLDLGDPEVAAAFEACQDLIGPEPGEEDIPGVPEDSADEGATT